MKIIENELTAMFDVDETLVMWHRPVSDDSIAVTCPYTNVVDHLVPHKEHIHILKQQKGRGYHVTVWSAGGWLWAKTIVEALGLTDYVDEVRAKPVKAFDDMPADRILNVIYIPFKETK